MKIIPAKTHTIIGLIIGIVLLIAPWLFGFSDIGGASMIVAIVIGLAIILSELTATSPLSPVRLVPMKAHIVTDYIAGACVGLSPWLFNFYTAPARAWLPHLFIGIATIGYALLTDPSEERFTVAHR